MSAKQTYPVDLTVDQMWMVLEALVGDRRATQESLRTLKPDQEPLRPFLREGLERINAAHGAVSQTLSAALA